MKAIKSILVGIALLVPAGIVAAALTLTLAAADYEPDPGGAVGLTLWSSWCLFCAWYFKNSHFLGVGLVLLAAAVVGLTLAV